jgi:hypothetical protein
VSEKSHQIFKIDVERFDCKRSQCSFVDKLAHSNSLINVQPEENGMYPTVMPFYGISTYGMLRKKTFGIDELQCCSDVEVLVCKAVKCSSVGGQKKIGVD